MDIWIKGPGALGTRIALACQSSGHNPVLIGRKGRIYPDVKLSDDRTISFADKPDMEKGPDLVIVTTKAYDLVKAIKEIELNLVNCSVPVIVLANGFYDNELVPLSNHLNIFCGAASFAGYFTGDGKYVIADDNGHATVNKQSLDQRHFLETDLIEKLPGFSFEKERDEWRQTKWVINCCLNTLTAALSLPRNGDVLNHQDELRDLFNESVIAAQTLFARPIHDMEHLWQQLLKVVHSTSNNQNSMYTDLLKRRKTEVNYLTGCIRDRKKFPTMLQFTKLIYGHEKNNKMT